MPHRIAFVCEPRPQKLKVEHGRSLPSSTRVQTPHTSPQAKSVGPVASDIDPTCRLAEYFRKAQADSRKGAGEGRKLLKARLAA
jgi:hypothetical protein